MDVPVSLFLRVGDSLSEGARVLAPAPLAPEDPSLQYPWCRCHSMMGRLEMGQDYHSGSTPAEMIEVEDIAVPSARKACNASQPWGRSYAILGGRLTLTR